MGYKRCVEGHLMDSSWKYCPICLAPLAGWLVVQDSKQQSHKFYTIHEGKTTIGSGSECDIKVSDLNLLRQQALFVVQNGECEVTDLSADNNMKINHNPSARSPIMDGDVVELNGVEFTMKLLGSGGSR